MSRAFSTSTEYAGKADFSSTLERDSYSHLDGYVESGGNYIRKEYNWDNSYQL